MEETKSLTIKSWAEEDRPREKLLGKGRHVLTDAELIAILSAQVQKKKPLLNFQNEFFLSLKTT